MNNEAETACRAGAAVLPRHPALSIRRLTRPGTREYQFLLEDFLNVVTTGSEQVKRINRHVREQKIKNTCTIVKNSMCNLTYDI